MNSEILSEIDCSDFYLDYNPLGWFEMVFDDETTVRYNRIYVDSIDAISPANWISLSRNFIKLAQAPALPTLH